MNDNKKSFSQKIVVNRKIKYNFSVEETFDAGIVLLGWEVKALRHGKVNITNSYISFKSSEAYLIGSQFVPVSQSNLYMIYEPNRIRKILLRKNEIIYLYNKVHKSKLTIVVLSMFFRNNWCKTKIGVAKGRQIKDKREYKKQNEWKREKNRFLKK